MVALPARREIDVVPLLEVDSNAREHEPAQGVVHLRESVAVAERGIGHFAPDDRWFLVEQIIGAEAEIILVGDPRGERQVEVALRIDLLVGGRDRSDAPVGRDDVAIAAEGVVLDRGEIPPAAGNPESVREGEARP